MQASQNGRLAAVGVTPKPRRPGLPEGGPSAASALKGRRDVWFAEAGGFRPTQVLDRGKLLRGNVIDGPAIIEEPEPAHRRDRTVRVAVRRVLHADEVSDSLT